MRTVSFSSTPVRRLLNSEFVSHIINTEGDPSAGSSHGHAPNDQAGICTDGIGRQNVQVLFLTPQGKIFHTASGFQGPQELLNELQFAKATFASIQKQPNRAREIVRNVHAKILEEKNIATSSKPTSTPFELLESLVGLGNIPNRTGRRTNRSTSGGRVTPRNMASRIFAAKTQAAETGDCRFMINHPLIAYDDFEKNPRLLVGNSHTAFVSGSPSGGKIGN
jgi:hypothetical protein